MPRLPSSENVPQVPPETRRGLGVQVPAGAYASDTAIVSGELAPAIHQYAQVAQRQQNRADTVDRSSLINQYHEDVSQELRRLNTESDLSREDVLSGFGSFMTKHRQELVDSHQGSPDSRALLETRLQDVGAQFTGQAAGISAKLGLDKVKTTFNYAINPLIQQAAQNPTLGNINKQLLGVDTAIGDLKGAINPAEEGSLRHGAQEAIALGAVNNLLARGRVDSAEALMDAGGMGRYLSPTSLRQTEKRIEAIRFHQENMQNRLTTKEALNLDTGQLQFATEAQIAANPRLVPKAAGKEDSPKFTAARVALDKAFNYSEMYGMKDPTQLPAYLRALKTLGTNLNETGDPNKAASQAAEEAQLWHRKIISQIKKDKSAGKTKEEIANDLSGAGLDPAMYLK